MKTAIMLQRKRLDYNLYNKDDDEYNGEYRIVWEKTY